MFLIPKATRKTCVQCTDFVAASLRAHKCWACTSNATAACVCRTRLNMIAPYLYIKRQRCFMPCRGVEFYSSRAANATPTTASDAHRNPITRRTRQALLIDTIETGQENVYLVHNVEHIFLLALNTDSLFHNLSPSRIRHVTGEHFKWMRLRAISSRHAGKGCAWSPRPGREKSSRGRGKSC